ncbi:trans-sulfuration enzyme family protein [Acetonema longum]|uniref:Cystathionine gamma-synthase n=1 Tax=Acetonema longum DSM 6540 TaxID=1009370 RepID=F7NHC4_9FIRM|nr:PLP-dependent aspartate aminotransferase family protein [Acetonema longum]EGO64607.1 Cystathionine gamma-synthase [Acetonema longum DSM 6540]
MKISSKVVQVGVNTDARTGAISTPIYQTATFRHPALGQSTGFDYSRTHNPTRQVLEQAIAALEGGSGGYAFASGMAAVTAILMLYRAGDHLVVVEDCYGGTYRVLEKNFQPFGLTTTFVDGSRPEEITAAIKPNTKAIIVETPTNPLMKIVDIRAIVKIAAAHGLHTVVDNTFLTPYFQRPLELGADLVVHSGTKYLSGHNDVLCGLVVAKDSTLAEKVKFVQNSTGNVLGPFDSWLLIRGMKTLALRMEKHNQNALTVAQWLEKHPHVKTVYFPGLVGHPGKSVHDSQATGSGGMLSFAVDDPKLVPQVLKKVKMIQFAESLGGVESLITFPAVQTHADVPPDVRERLGISDRLLRLSVGIEDAWDIIADLEQALQ